MKKENAEKGTNTEINKGNKFLQLPNDILLSICSFFNKKDLARTASTCKQLNELAKNLKLKSLPWPAFDYSSPPVRCNKVIHFKAAFPYGFGDVCTHLELLPNSYLAVMGILNYKDNSTWYKDNHTWQADIQVWDLAKGQQVKTFAINDNSSLEFILGLSEKCFITIQEQKDNTSEGNVDVISIIGVWDTNLEHCLQQIKVNEMITAIAKVSDHHFAIATKTAVQLWDLKSEQCVKTFDNCGVKINKLLVIPEKGILISGDYVLGISTTIKLWDIKTGKLLNAFSSEPVLDLTLMPNNLLVSLSLNNIQVWNIETAECIKTFQVRYGSNDFVISLVALSKDYVLTAGKDHVLTMGYCSSLRIWRLKDGKCIRNLGGKNLILKPSEECALPKRLPDGNLVSYYASNWYDRSIRIWKFPELKLENSEITENQNESLSKCSLQ